jgi:hypothetical protein
MKRTVFTIAALRLAPLGGLHSTLPSNKLVLHEPVDAAGQVEKK